MADSFQIIGVLVTSKKIHTKIFLEKLQEVKLFIFDFFDMYYSSWGE